MERPQGGRRGGVLVNSAEMANAFDLVAPSDWRAEIDAHVTGSALAEQGLTIRNVAEAVEFYTATEATFVPEGDGFRVKAAGYRAGPAGP